MEVREKRVIMGADDALAELSYLGSKKVEHFGIMCLDGANRLLSKTVLFKGGYTSSTVDIRCMLYYAIMHRACAVIVFHNHPSGSTSPSKEDLKTTKRIKEAFDLCGMQVLDHIIVTKGDYYSFLENGAF